MNYTKEEWYVKGLEVYAHIKTDNPQLPNEYHTRIASLLFCGCGERDREANTQLIASAPDLYEACKGLSPCQRPINGAEVCFEWAVSEKAMKVVREALAKAEGK